MARSRSRAQSRRNSRNGRNSSRNNRKSRNSRNSRCPSGTIRRRSFQRRAPNSQRRVSVRSTCVPDTGAPGKTPANRRILPRPGDIISLRKFGYSTHSGDRSRQSSLRRAAERHGSLKVLRRLNLIRNFQPDPEAKEVMSEDVNYMSRFHRRNPIEDRPEDE